MVKLIGPDSDARDTRHGPTVGTRTGLGKIVTQVWKASRINEFVNDWGSCPFCRQFPISQDSTDEWVALQCAFGTPSNYFGKVVRPGSADQFLVCRPGERRNLQQKLHYSQIEQGMPDIDGNELVLWLVEQRCRWYEGYCRHFGLELQPAFVADDFAE